MSEHNEAPKLVGELLDRVVRSLTGAPAVGLANVFSQWQAIVGDTIAAHTRPVSLDDGVLLVAVDEPGWATQLRYLETDLLARIAGSIGAGTVTRIEVRVRPA